MQIMKTRNLPGGVKLDKQKIYLNTFGGRLTGQDFVLLGSLQPGGGAIENPDDAEFEIYLSPASLKTVHTHLTRALQVYEAMFGEIQPITKDAVVRARDLVPGMKVRVMEESEEQR